MNTPIRCFRLQDLDWVYLQKRAAKQKITTSELLRRIINSYKITKKETK